MRLVLLSMQQLVRRKCHIMVYNLNAWALNFIPWNQVPQEDGIHLQDDLFVSVSVLGRRDDSRSTPLGPNEEGIYEFNMSRTFKWPLNEHALSDLLNTELKITIHKSDTGLSNGSYGR